jgi:methyl-accepting chemotaxis protein
VVHSNDKDFDFTAPLVAGRSDMVRALTIAGLVIALFGAAGALWFARRMTRPIRAVAGVLEDVSQGDFSRDVDHSSNDEIGQMAASLNRAVARMREITDALTSVAAGNTEVAVTVRGERDELGRAAHAFLVAQREGAAQTGQMATMSDRLAELLTRVSDYSVSLTKSSGELRSISQQLTASAEQTSVQARVVSKASADVQSHNTALTSAVGEISVGFGEVSRNANQASGVAEQAVLVAVEANQIATRLAASSAEIENVVETIGSIADATNLLALNATIEAARAGDAGRGFAVVAHEVKDLASETSQATNEISNTIGALQADTAAVIDAISRIGTIISTISAAQTSIASVVEEQTAAASQVVRNVADVTTSGVEIATNIDGVAHAASGTAAGAIETEASATELARIAHDLQQLIADFHRQSAADQRALAVQRG